MQPQPRRAETLILGSTIIVILVLAVVWAMAPEDLRGLLILAGGVVAAAVYVVLYAIERRVHW